MREGSEKVALRCLKPFFENSKAHNAVGASRYAGLEDRFAEAEGKTVEEQMVIGRLVRDLQGLFDEISDFPSQRTEYVSVRYIQN